MLGEPESEKSILVVDDEAIVRQMLEVVLRRSGFGVLLAADGPEALALYERHRPRIAVVLLDVRMPGLDGPQTLAALRQFDPGVRCCFMSGDTKCYSEQELLAQGAVCFFPKPFRSLDGLTQTLGHLVREG